MFPNIPPNFAVTGLPFVFAGDVVVEVDLTEGVCVVAGVSLPLPEVTFGVFASNFVAEAGLALAASLSVFLFFPATSSSSVFAASWVF